MANNPLYQALLEHSKVDPSTLDRLMAEVDDKQDARALGRLVLRDGLLGFYELMNLALNYDLFPRTQALLKRLAEGRAKRQVFKPQPHTTRYKLKDVPAVLSESLSLTNPTLTLNIPKPNLSQFETSGSDEHQVVEMAVELIRMGQYQEAEMFLVDAQDEFTTSMRIKVLLIWLYMLCKRFDDAFDICQKALELAPSEPAVLEYAGLIEQARNKHRLAIIHFQKLLQQAKVKPSWHLLLGVSLEKARLPDDARLHYQRYLELGKSERLIGFAKQRLNQLAD